LFQIFMRVPPIFGKALLRHPLRGYGYPSTNHVSGIGLHDADGLYLRVTATGSKSIFTQTLGDGTEAFQLSRREHKKVETRFAHMKRIHKLDRLRLRGLIGCERRGAAHRDGTKPEAARKAPLPSPAPGARSHVQRKRPVASSVGGVDAAAP
jgi:hypothetical protein